MDDDGEEVRLGIGTTLPDRVSNGTPASADVNLGDDDDPEVEVEFASASYSAGEGESVDVQLTLSADPERTVVIPLVAINQGGATSSDYSAPNSVTFNSGQTVQNVTVRVEQDTLDDDDESVKLTLGLTLPSRVTAGAQRETVVSFTDNDDPEVTVGFATTTYSAREGETANVKVTLSADPERTVIIPIVPTDQDGAASTDYSTPLSVRFDTGETEQTLAFSATQDDEDDDGESVRLAFGSLPARVSEGAVDETTVSLEDDDNPRITVWFGSAAHAVDEGATTSVQVVLSADPERTVTIPLTTTNLLGASASDYSAPTSVTLDAGETTTTFTFGVTQDEVDDDGESVQLGFGALPDRVSEGTPASSEVSLGDDDDPEVRVQFSQAVYTVAEGGSATLEVTLSADPERTVTIPLTSTEQGGISAADYSGIPSSLTFNAGDTYRAFPFRAAQDDIDDDDESVRLGFGTLPPRVSTGDVASITVSITDDDVPSVTVSFEQDAYTVAEGKGVTVTVVLSEPPERSVTVPIERSGLRGISDLDYRGVPASITFGPTDTRESFVFTAVDDDDDDDGERLELSFGSLPTRVSEAVPMTATVTISDKPVVTLVVSPRAIEEPGGTRPSTTTVTALLDKPSPADTIVTISTDPPESEWFALSDNRELTIRAGNSTSTGLMTITALNVVGDHRVLTVKGAARNSEGVDASDPVGLRVYSRDAGVIGHAENDTDPVATFTSTDPENGRAGQGIDWDVTGVDAADFLIDARGTLIFRRSPDHEAPTDRGRSDVDVNGDGDTDDTGEVAVTGDDNMYQITLRATEQMTGGPDDRAFTAESHFTVVVFDVNEPGELTMNRLQPEVGTPITATLSDPDGDIDTDGTVVSGDDEVTLGWQWYVSKVQDPVEDVDSHWTAATGAGNDTATYTPAGVRVTDTTSTVTDEGRYLRAVVRYLDMGVEDTDEDATVGMVRKESAVSANPVHAEVTSDLDVVRNTENTVSTDRVRAEATADLAVRQNTENGSPGFSPANSYTRTVP